MPRLIRASHGPLRMHVLAAALLASSATAVAVYADSAAKRPSCSNPKDCPPRAQEEVCSGISPSGDILYFPCGEQPQLACAMVSPEGEIIYFTCKSQPRATSPRSDR
jgi:hypothetical protein